MTSSRFIYYIISAFIAGNVLLIFLQYNSAKNTSNLIGGNEQLLDQFSISRELRDLEKEVISIESSIRGMIVTRDSSHITGLERKISAVENSLHALQRIGDNDSSTRYVDELDRLVHAKLDLGRQVLDTFYTSGKEAAEALISLPENKQLTDTITAVIQKIDNSRQELLTSLTASVDESGKQAQRWGTILIIVVLISGAGLFWFIIDKIRQQNQLIRQLDASEKQVREMVKVKENFMANMSHEIRTPMNAILGFTHLLQQKELDAEGSEYIRSISQSGETLLTIINDILDLSKIEAGMLRIESAPFSIRAVIRSVELLFSARAKEKNLELKSRIADSIPDNLEGDATRLTQVLVNLVSNAIKFTDKGHVLIKVDQETKKDNTLTLAFEVADTGIGIDPGKLDRIFDRFEQAEDSITRRYGGTGLGLAIVQELVQLQGGTIGVQSEANKGTRFYFTLSYPTLTVSASNEENTIADQPAADLSAANDVTVLLVEDNLLNQNLMKHLLNRWHIDFIIAGNGREAIEQLQKNPVDLVLMDIQMPEIDGYATTRLLREELNLTIPVIAMTAHAFAGEREKCISAGMNDYISKPIKEDKLYALLSRYIQLKPAQTAGRSVINTGDYQYIDLGYMKEVSSGNREYEQTVTEQFLEMIPADLELLEKQWQEKNWTAFRQTAHNMKTSIAVMGLTSLLQPHLDKMEQEGQEAVYADSLEQVKEICTAALQEARQFLKSFKI